VKITIVRVALACAALAISAGVADATVTPIQGTDVGLEHDPQGIITQGTTDGKGSVTFAKLAPGRYAVVLTGKGAAAAIDRLAKGGRKVSGLTVAIAIGGGAPTLHPVGRARTGGVPEGVRIGFTIPGRAAGGTVPVRPVDVRVTISDQGAAGGMTSY
jgi:hypothetical protein